MLCPCGCDPAWDNQIQATANINGNVKLFMLQPLLKDMQQLADPQKAGTLMRFFKCGPGQYGQGDVFLGIMVPQQRKLAGKYADLALEDIRKLLESKIHERRLTALLILAGRYGKASARQKQELFAFYLAHAKWINNWDLVDLSAPNIVGDFLLLNPAKSNILLKLARSDDIWERRMAVVATFAFIRKNDFSWTFRIAELLLKDKHDLVHKAAGWMLREAGNRNAGVLEEFLDRHAAIMPRTMLRYAIEKLPGKRRKQYLALHP
jgi:3-methyladenine DNA glycosylase AlkD